MVYGIRVDSNVISESSNRKMNQRPDDRKSEVLQVGEQECDKSQKEILNTGSFRRPTRRTSNRNFRSFSHLEEYLVSSFSCFSGQFRQSARRQTSARSTSQPGLSSFPSQSGSSQSHSSVHSDLPPVSHSSILEHRQRSVSHSSIFSVRRSLSKRSHSFHPSTSSQENVPHEVYKRLTNIPVRSSRSQFQCSTSSKSSLQRNVANTSCGCSSSLTSQPNSPQPAEPSTHAGDESSSDSDTSYKLIQKPSHLKKITNRVKEVFVSAKKSLAKKIIPPEINVYNISDQSTPLPTTSMHLPLNQQRKDDTSKNISTSGQPLKSETASLTHF